jgi:3-oxoacyl-[acyl-carrier-protein] synthase III
MNSQIIATGSYFPKKLVTNHDLAKLFTTSDEWIREKTGIEQRYFAAPGEGASDLALKAAQKALKAGNLSADDIDAIIFSTSSPDYQAPGSGILLQNKLGAKKIPAYDIRNTSPGFLCALDLADGLIKTNRYKNVLTVCAEVHSTALDFTDRGRLMAVIFGDGAGAAIIQATNDDKGLKDFIMHSDGKDFNKLWCEGPSSLRSPRVTKEQIDAGIFHPKMDGRYVYEHAVKNMTAVVKELLIKNKMGIDDIDLFLFHQANKNILEVVRKNLNLDVSKTPSNLAKSGNTNSATIPILLDELWIDGKIHAGQKIILTSFGSGFSWGSCLIEL